MKGVDVEAIQIKGPQREEKETAKGAGAEAIHIKGQQRDENKTIKRPDAWAIQPAEGGTRDIKGSGRRGYTDRGPTVGGKGDNE